MTRAKLVNDVHQEDATSEAGQKDDAEDGSHHAPVWGERCAASRVAARGALGS